MTHQTEKGFSQQVRDWARLRGWMSYFTYRSTHSPAGFPDWVFVRGERVIFAELKSAKGKTTAAQDEWLAALRETPAEVYLWKPEQFDEMITVLT